MDIFATGMRRWDHRIYVDLFAGPGKCVCRGEPVPGSPLIALRYPFTRLIYVEKSVAAMSALKERLEPQTHERDIRFVNGDCNARVDEIVGHLPKDKVSRSRTLVFLFADPTNWQVNFETIRRIAEGFRVDILLTFMSGLMKRVPTDPVKALQLDRFFGTTEWRNLKPRSLDALVRLYRRQLEPLGYVDHEPQTRILVRNSKNSPMYELAYFSMNPKGYEFWDKISVYDERGQSALIYTR